jgi:1-aminocyclopropane-1-carboxylate deaminase/D-cysteine desulfhydrase-like pyridoxal-dependent ACC family enzyme
MNLKRFPRHSLTFGPTPIQPLKRLSAHLGGKVELYAKREDCNSGLAFGGNKTRKLEYLIPERWRRAATRWCPSAASSRTRRARWRPWPRTWA